MCNCGKICKNNRGLRIHQEKIKCQTLENKLVAPPQKCFVSLQNIILSSCLTFDDGVCYRTSDNTFIPTSNSEKPVAGNKCYVLSCGSTNVICGIHCVHCSLVYVGETGRSLRS